MDHKLLLNFAMQAGEIMLRSGAETYRVEDTIMRILSVYDFESIEVFVTPTGIIATIDDKNIEMTTKLKRINSRTIRLDKVALVNDLSRKYVLGKISLQDAIEELKKIDKISPYQPLILISVTGLTSAFFTIVFGGNYKDFLISLSIGIILGIIQRLFINLQLSRFLADMLGGFLVGFLALLLTSIIPSINFDNIIIGSIMPMVPGVAITNAIRDTIEGNLLSGISRGVEAFFVAISIATGVAIALKVWLPF